jgi:hypothetical protein
MMFGKIITVYSEIHQKNIAVGGQKCFWYRYYELYVLIKHVATSLYDHAVLTA